MAWTLIASLVELRNEFNRLVPGRDKGADGSIGDSAHTSRSDHTPDEDSSYLRDHDADSKNEVHALDIDSTGPWPPGRTFEQIVMRIIAGERAKWQSKTDRCRLKYVIFNRKIYSQSSDFMPVKYTGSDPHTNHAHFSGRYETACENDTRPWGVHPAPTSGGGNKDEEKDVEEFFASIGRAVRGENATEQDRANRNNFAAALRFTLGLNGADQTAENLPLGDSGLLERAVTAVEKLAIVATAKK